MNYRLIIILLCLFVAVVAPDVPPLVRLLAGVACGVTGVCELVSVFRGGVGRD